MNIDYLSNCVFVDESAFDINMRPSTARSAKGTPAIFTTPSTHAVSHTILGAISAMGVVNIEIGLHNLKPKRIRVDGSRKRKQPQPKKPASKGTATGHYMLFLQNTMNFMERMTWSEKGTRAVMPVPQTRAKTTTISWTSMNNSKIFILLYGQCAHPYSQEY